MKLSKFYLMIILLLILVLPVISVIIDSLCYHQSTNAVLLTGKWFVFWAIGVRLFTAGLRQTTKPAFTAQEIFHITNKEASLIVIELGFANICLGLTGIISLFIPQWRPAAAFAGGLYLGIAGIYHLVKKPASPNEVLAMVSDLFIFAVLAVYLYISIF